MKAKQLKEMKELAGKLREAGMSKQADAIDKFIKEAQEKMKEYPWDVEESIANIGYLDQPKGPRIKALEEPDFPESLRGDVVTEEYYKKEREALRPFGEIRSLPVKVGNITVVKFIYGEGNLPEQVVYIDENGDLKVSPFDESFPEYERLREIAERKISESVQSHGRMTNLLIRRQRAWKELAKQNYWVLFDMIYRDMKDTISKIRDKLTNRVMAAKEGLKLSEGGQLSDEERAAIMQTLENLGSDEPPVIISKQLKRRIVAQLSNREKPHAQAVRDFYKAVLDYLYNHDNFLSNPFRYLQVANYFYGGNLEKLAEDVYELGLPEDIRRAAEVLNRVSPKRKPPEVEPVTREDIFERKPIISLRPGEPVIRRPLTSPSSYYPIFHLREELPPPEKVMSKADAQKIAIIRKSEEELIRLRRIERILDLMKGIVSSLKDRSFDSSLPYQSNMEDLLNALLDVAATIFESNKWTTEGGRLKATMGTDEASWAELLNSVFILCQGWQAYKTGWAAEIAKSVGDKIEQMVETEGTSSPEGESKLPDNDIKTSSVIKNMLRMANYADMTRFHLAADYIDKLSI